MPTDRLFESAARFYGRRVIGVGLSGNSNDGTLGLVATLHAGNISEALVATFKAREKPELLLYAGAVLASVGVVLAAWGLLIRLNRYAEELEPEAMAEAKLEDAKLR